MQYQVTTDIFSRMQEDLNKNLQNKFNAECIKNLKVSRMKLWNVQDVFSVEFRYFSSVEIPAATLWHYEVPGEGEGIALLNHFVHN